MPVETVIGAQWGDEGKGKIVDHLAQSADLIIRATGGNNAGHTIINEYGQFALHLVPGGIFNPQATCIIGPGTVVDPASLLDEMDTLREKNIEVPGRLYVSSKAHLIMPWHKAIDRAEEKRRNESGVKLGTTLRGIGPCFQDKASRKGLRVECLLDFANHRRQFEELYKEKIRLLENEYDYTDLEECSAIWNTYLRLAEELRPFIRDTDSFVWDAMDEGKNILIEGAQGALLDVDHGTYPYVTSTDCSTAGVAQGAGIDPRAIGRVIGVVKAYTTRIGAGPFPTEAPEAVADDLRERGNEYGATTGRPRRCGWLDIPLLKYAHALNGFTEIALTKIDILSGLTEVPMAVAYVDWNEDVPKPTFRASMSKGLLERTRPWYEHFPGWSEDLSKLSKYVEFPREAQQYIAHIQKLLGVPIRFISNGPEREQLITLDET